VEGNWNRPPTNFGLKVALSAYSHLHLQKQCYGQYVTPIVQKHYYLPTGH